MRSEDPYAAPDAAVSDPIDHANKIRWKRIVGWGALICATNILIYMLSGAILPKLNFHGISIDMVAASLGCFVLYLIFLRATSHRHFLQLICVYFIVQVFGIAIAGGFGLLIMLLAHGSVEDVVSFAELGRNLLACLLAYAAWYMTSRRTDTP